MDGWGSDLCRRREASPGLGIGLVVMMTAIAVEFPSKVWLGRVTRHQVSRDCRCADSPLPSLGYSHWTSSSEAVPAKAPKASQGPQGLKGPKAEKALKALKDLKAASGPRRPTQAPQTMSLGGEQRADKEKGKVGIIKKVCEQSHQSMSSLTSLE